MTRHGLLIAGTVAMLLMPVAATGQSAPSLPSHVVDVRVPMSGVPASGGFYPALPARTLVPKRGFGVDVGGHLYVAGLGPAKVGVGVDVLHARGTAVTPGATASTASKSAVASNNSSLSEARQVDVTVTMTAVMPQLSFNFGTRDGWSYLSGGYGMVRVASTATGAAQGASGGRVTVAAGTGVVPAINYGGGARWFVREHVAAGFDVRFLRVAGAPARASTTLVVVAVGLSVR